MTQLQPTPADTKPLRWIAVGCAVLAIALLSNLALYPQPTAETVLIALRITSLTTALPFLLVFSTRPLVLVSRELAQWAQAYRRELWLVLTASHLLHLYQIGLYYQLGQQCPLTVWLITAPVWIITVLAAVVEIVRSQWFEGRSPAGLKLLYSLGLGYVWLVFTLAFGLGAIARHLPFCNIPSFLLFLAAGVLHLVTWWQRMRLT